MPHATDTSVRIRAARASDERAVAQLCRRVWIDDYVPHVFSDFVRDRRGRLWIAMLDGRVVGVAKLTVSGDREAWLHALRVDPRFRRRGIATLLLEHRLARARRLGARVARLDTSEENIAVRRLMRRYGFRLRGRYAFFDAAARAGEPPRVPSAGELPELWRALRRGDGYTHGAFAVRRVTAADVARAVRRGECLVAGPPGRPRSVALFEVEPRREGVHGGRPRIAIRAIGGTGQGITELLDGVRRRARREQVERAGILAPSRMWSSVASAGFRRRWTETMLLYERAL